MKYVLLVALVVAGGIIGYAAAQTQNSSSVDVQIVARKTENNRIEFGLRQGDSQPTFPRARFFPLNVDHHDWLSSSPIRVNVGSFEQPPKRRHVVSGDGASLENLLVLARGTWEITYISGTCAVRITGAFTDEYTSAFPPVPRQVFHDTRGGAVNVVVRDCSDAWSVAFRLVAE